VQSIGDRILIIRQEAKLSQEAFGLKIGVSQAHVSDLEKGRHNAPEALRNSICYRFHIDEEWLLTGKGEQKAKIPLAFDNTPMVDSAESITQEEGDAMLRLKYTEALERENKLLRENAELKEQLERKQSTKKDTG